MLKRIVFQRRDDREAPTAAMVEALVARIAARCDDDGLVVFGIEAYEVAPSGARFMHMATLGFLPAGPRAPTSRGAIAAIVTRDTLTAMMRRVVLA